MRRLLVTICLFSLFGCATQMHQFRFLGTWKMRDATSTDYYLRIYPNGWVAQWPNPVGTTAWARLRGQTLAWGYRPPLRDPKLAVRGSSLIMHVAPSAHTFDRVRDIEPPPPDNTSPADY